MGGNGRLYQNHPLRYLRLRLAHAAKWLGSHSLPSKIHLMICFGPMLNALAQCVVGHEIVGTAVKVGSKAEHGIKSVIRLLKHPNHPISGSQFLGLVTVSASAPSLRRA